MSKYTQLVERRAAGDFEIEQDELRPFVEAWMIAHGFSLLDGDTVEAFWAAFADGADEGWKYDDVVGVLQQVEREVRP